MLEAPYTMPAEVGTLHSASIKIMIEGLQQCMFALVSARCFLYLARFRAGAIAMAIAVAVAMPTLDELGVDLFGAIEALAVKAIIWKRHELLELLAEADTRRPFIKMEDMIDGPLRLDVDEFVVTTSQSDERAGVDLRLFAQAMDRGRDIFELAVAGMMHVVVLSRRAGNPMRLAGRLHTRQVDGDRIVAGEHAQVRHNWHIGEVHAITAWRHIDRQIDEGNLAVDRFDRRQAGISDGGIGGFKVGFRDLEQVAGDHHADAPQTARALGAIPGDAAIVHLEQIIGAAIFEDIPVRSLSLAFEILRMPERRVRDTILGMSTKMNVMLAALRLGPDAQVLDGAADHPQRMAFEMCQGDQDVGCSDCLRHIRLFQDVAFGEVDAIVAGADETIGDDEGTAQRRRCEAIALGRHQEV